MGRFLRFLYTVVHIVLHCVPPSFAHPQCLDASPPSPSPLTMCTQYSESACCSPEQETMVVDTYQLVKHRLSQADWKTCQGYVKDLLCQKCSPLSAHMYDADARTDNERALPGLCKDFCTEFYHKCRDVVWFLDPDLAPMLVYQNVSTFCAKYQISDMTYCYPKVFHEMTPEVNEDSNLSSEKGCLCLEPVIRGLANPIVARYSGDGTGRLFVAEQRGKVYVVDLASKELLNNPFLDISNRIILSYRFGDERGMGGMAFHPNFTHNGRLFVYYNAPMTPEEKEGGRQVLGPPWDHRSVLSEMRVLPDQPDVVDPAFEKVLLEIVQPFANHNGGETFFLDDGYLYLFLGDGGYAGDPFNLAQNRSWLLGKVLRLDVDTPSDVKDRHYSIPPDNPFVQDQDPGVRPEIFAYGVRNIWRCGVDVGDPHTGSGRGRVLCGDVGQSHFEEVDLLKKGANYGWRAREGMQCYDQAMCNHVGEEELPVHTYNHSVGQSVTGGQFYRGCRSPSLNGKYLYADYQSGRLFSLEETQEGKWRNADVSLCGDDICTGNLTNALDKYILSFGLDQQGEVYMLTSASSVANKNDGNLFLMVDPFSEKTADDCKNHHN